MKKLILASAVALMAITAMPAQAELKTQPWRYTGAQLVNVGGSGWIKACFWYRSEVVNGVMQGEMTTTYTSRYGSCPAPQPDILTR